MSTLGRALGIAIMLAVVVLVVGVWLEWFEVEASREERQGEEEIGIRIRVDEDKIEAGKEKLEEKLESATDGLGGRKIEGRVAHLAPESGLLVVRTEGEPEEISVLVTEETSVRVDEVERDAREPARKIDRIHAGDHVEIEYELRDGERVAQEVRISRAGRP